QRCADVAGQLESAVAGHPGRSRGPAFEAAHERGRSAQPQVRPGSGQAPDVRAGDARVKDVAEDHDLATMEVAPGQALAQGEQVKEGLAGMGVPAVTAVEDRT